MKKIVFYMILSMLCLTACGKEKPKSAETDAAQTEVVQTENAQTEAEAPDASGVTRDEVMAFLSSPGANGLLNGEFSDIESACISVMDMVYQVNSSTVDSYQVMEVLEESGEEIYTDITCLTTKEVDRLTRQILGVNGDHPSISYDTDYLESLDVWYLQHGDTNHVGFTLGEITAEKDKVTAILTDVGTYDSRDIKVTLERNEFGGLRYRAIERIGEPKLE